MYRMRTVKVPAIGRGKCPSPRSRSRLQRRVCNTQRCPTVKKKVLKCKSEVDLVLLLDGSGSVGSSGWKATLEFAETLVMGFKGEATQVSVILFSGPRSWPHYRQCQKVAMSKADLLKKCGLTMVQHFSNDTEQTQKNIKALKFPAASTWTAKALEMAAAELTLGRKNAKRVVLVMTDGIPISPHKTKLAAIKVKRRARLMFGAVRLSGRGLRYMMQWSSRPQKDNVMRIKDFASMKKVSTINSLIRDMCSSVAVK